MGNMEQTYRGIARTRLSCTTALILVVLTVHPVFAQDQLLPVLHIEQLHGFKPEWVTARTIRDSIGFVWIGTQNGLRRYDGYEFKEYRNIPGDPHSLSSNRIHSLLLDSKQRLWVGTVEAGLSLYDRAYDRFINFYPYPDDPFPYARMTVFAVLEDHSRNLWLATAPAGVVHVEVPSMRGTYDNDSLARGLHFRRIPLGTRLNKAYDICERKDGKILVASDSGLILVDPVTCELSRPRLADQVGHRLDSLSLRCFLQESDGNLWVGTSTQGLFRVNWDTRHVTNYRHKEEDGLSITVDDIWDLAEDRRGYLWIGTINGVDLFSPSSGQRVPYLTVSGKPRGADRIRLSVDGTGTLWIGTMSGVYRLSQRSQLFPLFSLPHPDGSPSTFDAIERGPDGHPWCFSEGKLLKIDITTREVLKTIDVTGGTKPLTFNPNRARSLRDRKGNLWYGAYNLGLYNVNPASGLIKNYRYHSPFGGVNRVRSIVQGPGDSLWIAAVEHGLMKFDPVSGRFFRTPFARAANIMKATGGRLWIATEGDGLDVYDPATGGATHYSYDGSNSGSLSRNLTWSTYQDPAGRIWVGAGNDIDLWDPSTSSFSRYPNPTFKSAASAFPIGSDRMGRLWVWYTDAGLAILDPSSGEFKNFDSSEGICGYVFDMENLDDGRVLVAGERGLNIVSPDSIDTHRSPPPLVITRLAINDEPVVPDAHFQGSGSLRLSHAQNVIELEFAAIDIDAPDLVQYQYRLEGLEEDWVRPKDRRYVRYTALPRGDYVFRVRAASSRGEWPDQEIALAVIILPPWWGTSWAYGAYGVLLVGLLYAGSRLKSRQVRLRQEAELGQFKAEHLAEVDRLKSRFFANISHEFRTPLTLILGPLEKIRSTATDENTLRAVAMMKRNAHELLGLINQLLELSKLEAGAMRLKARRGNIVPVIKGIAYSFESSAGLRQIELTLSVDHDEILVYFDREKIEKILSNLLSNAFKFTPAGGKVEVDLRLPPHAQPANPVPRAGGPENEVLEISIADTGIGIPADRLPHVFDRFYQVDESATREHGGTGIGLALVKELVELHHGTIRVTSQPGVGTRFTVSLLRGRDHLRADEIEDGIMAEEREIAVPDPMSELRVAPPESELAGERNEGKNLILIVEDNADVREYLKDNLTASYSVIEATDGVEGVDKARETIPDLIISDVMMPGRDGYGLCRTLKNDMKTSHIPIILLTARAASEDRIGGLERGADDYIIKPFEPKELMARISNLVSLRRKLRERFKLTVPLKPGEVAVASMDDAFLARVMAAVEHHMGEERFGTEELASEVGMSRMQVHRKLSALTNQSAGEFIRSLRLHRAMELLQKDAGTVSEIAYMVGFSDPSYFSKCFHKQFGKVPTEVRNAPAKPDNSNFIPPA